MGAEAQASATGRVWIAGDLGPATAAAVKARTGKALRAGKGWAGVTLEAWAAAHRLG